MGLLLDAPPIPKDASKAVKRISPDFGQIITPETLTELLGLPNMLVSGFFLEKKKMIITSTYICFVNTNIRWRFALVVK